MLPDALGMPLDQFSIRNLSREHARRIQDKIAERVMRNGSAVGPATVPRQLGVLQVMINPAESDDPILGDMRNSF